MLAVFTWQKHKQRNKYCCCGILKNGKTNGITNWSKLREGCNSNKLEIVTQLGQIHILYFNLDCINFSDALQTLATNGSKLKIFSSNLLLVSQELFSNDYKKVWDIDIFGNFRNLAAKYLFNYL